MSIGFTLGKYAPFHRGHMQVIETALAEVDHLVVVIYDAKLTTSIPLETRASWIQKCFPAVDIVLARNGPEETGYTADIIQIQNDYLRYLLAGRKFDAFYSSEPYGALVSDAFACKDRRVDSERKAWPVSATMIRRDTRVSQDMVPPCVWASIKPKLYFLGGPSTGKSTLARWCSERFNGDLCEEYGRDYWFAHQKNHRLSMHDLEIIAREQTNCEESSWKSMRDIAFIDTSAITTLAYAHYYFDRASTALEKIVEKNRWKYRHVLLCGDEIPFEDTPDRSGPESRGRLQKINEQLLDKYKIPYTRVFGSREDRGILIQNYILKGDIWNGY